MKIPKTQYEKLHRFGVGLVVLCFILTVVGSILNGASLYEIAYRSILVVLVVGLATWVIVKFWVATDKMRVSSELLKEIDEL